MAEIKVVITDETGSQSTTSVNTPSESIPTPTTNAEKVGGVNSKSASESKANSKALAIAAMIGSRAFNYTTSNVGKWTGNSANQEKINNIMQIGGIASMAYINPYFAAATVAVSVATTAADAAFENKWNNKRSEARLAKAGYNSIGEVVGRRH